MTMTAVRSRLAVSLGLSLALCAFTPIALAQPHQQILTDAQQYKDEALKLLERLVNIDSGSGYVPGLTQVGDITIDELKKIGCDHRAGAELGR